VSEHEVVRAKVPWAGAKHSNAYSNADPQKVKGKLNRSDAMAEVCARRTPRQREDLLAQRLGELRDDPPRGFPR
jgi:hypothetical protein